MNARRFGADLAGYGVQVISGMAYGIDGIAQEEALNAERRRDIERKKAEKRIRK